MSLPRELLTAARHQAGNLRRLLRGQPVAPPGFECMTLDTDDLAVAAEWLGRRGEWGDEEPVRRYEAAFAAWLGAPDAFAFASGREALSAILHALELGPGDEVILPGYTCVVVPNALHFAGIEPVWCDIELETFGPDVASVEARLTPRVRAILLHHLYGLVCRDYEALLELARRRGLRVIEDCAQAAGARFEGRAVGLAGDAAFYSSERSKVLNTLQGGVAVVAGEEAARRLAAHQAAAPPPDADFLERLLRGARTGYEQWKHPGRWWRADWARLRDHRYRLVSTTAAEERGERPAAYGRRMAAPAAALGLNQLRKVERYNEQRRRAAARWRRWCEGRGLAPPLVLPGSTPVFLRYPVLVSPEEKRDPSWAMRELGVKAGLWFTSQLHPAPRSAPGCPRAEEAVARCLNLPTLTA